MNSRQKGKRNEDKARKILEADGWEVEIMPYTRYHHQDFFNLWDLLAVKSGRTKWVQVKSNRLPPPAYRDSLTSFQGGGDKELWIFYDRKKEPRIIRL